MAGRADALARQFETKADEATAVFERLSDTDWKKTTAAEQWSVGVVAHHVAGAHAYLAQALQAVAKGQDLNLAMDDLHAQNAKHAKEQANCTKAETIALHKKNVATTAAAVRGLNDADLARSATVIVGMPPMSAEELATGFLIGHIDEHLKSIRATLGG
jgi:hypothetical protein